MPKDEQKLSRHVNSVMSHFTTPKTGSHRLLNEIDDIIILLSPTLIITYITPSIKNLGYTQEELVGKNIDVLCSDEIQKNCEGVFWKRFKGKEGLKLYEIRGKCIYNDLEGDLLVLSAREYKSKTTTSLDNILELKLENTKLKLKLESLLVQNSIDPSTHDLLKADTDFIENAETPQDDVELLLNPLGLKFQGMYSSPLTFQNIMQSNHFHSPNNSSIGFNRNSLTPGGYPNITSTVGIPANNIISPNGSYPNITSTVGIPANNIISPNGSYPNSASTVGIPANNIISPSGSYPNITSTVGIPANNIISPNGTYPNITSTVGIPANNIISTNGSSPPSLQPPYQNIFPQQYPYLQPIISPYVTPSTSSGPATVASASVDPKKKKRKMMPEDLFCLQCGTRKSPEWRNGPEGPKTYFILISLCNACGLAYYKKQKKLGLVGR